MTKETIVTVFGSSRPREGDAEYDEARELGSALATSGFAVCSGGYGGVMAAVSRGAKEAGGKTYGVTTEFFSTRANPWIDEEVRVATWQDRLFELIGRAQGFVACKGGTGTLVEVAVVWEMLNKSVMSGKPLAVLGNFWTPILERVCEVEKPHRAHWNEAAEQLIYIASTATEVVHHLKEKLK
jgi:uncharacterized protein (TIGR00730 family)